MARATSSRIRPGIELNRIVLILDPRLPPTIELHGRVLSRLRTVNQSNSAVITTKAMDAKSAAYIEHIKAMFSEGFREVVE